MRISSIPRSDREAATVARGSNGRWRGRALRHGRHERHAFSARPARFSERSERAKDALGTPNGTGLRVGGVNVTLGPADHPDIGRSWRGLRPRRSMACFFRNHSRRHPPRRANVAGEEMRSRATGRDRCGNGRGQGRWVAPGLPSRRRPDRGLPPPIDPRGGTAPGTTVPGCLVCGGCCPPNPLAEGATDDSPPLHSPHSRSGLESEVRSRGGVSGTGMEADGCAGIAIPAEAG